MKNSYILYILGFVALVATGNALKHLARFGEWSPLVFVAIKDVVICLITIYLIRLIRTAAEVKVRMLAVRSMIFALMVSFIADTAITLFRI